MLRLLAPKNHPSSDCTWIQVSMSGLMTSTNNTVHLWPIMPSKINRHVIGSTLGLLEGKERPVFWDMPDNVGLLGRIKPRLSQVLLTSQIWICHSFVLSSNFINFKVYFEGITCNIQLKQDLQSFKGQTLIL